MTAVVPTLVVLCALVLGLAAGGALVLLTSGRGLRRAAQRAVAAQSEAETRERGVREAASAREREITEQMRAAEREAAQAERILRERIADLAAHEATIRAQFDGAIAARDEAAARAAVLEGELNAGREAALARERDLSRQLAEATALQAATQKSFDELTAARAEADSKFAELASKVIADAQAALLQTTTEKVKVEGEAARAEAHAKLATISAEMTTKLTELGAAVGNLQAARENDSVTLSERLAALGEQTKQMLGAVSETQTATNRVASLLSHRQNRGAWGEFELHRLIELTGMTEHVSFEVQQTGFGDEQRGRPDLVVHVAGGGMLPIDAKVPFDAYQASIDATDEEARAAAFAEAIAAFRVHVKTLAGRRYHARAGCVGWTLMFVPIESMLSSILAADASILVGALDDRILIVSPMTLFAYLTTIAHGWTLARQQENAEQILAHAKTLVERLGPFAGHLDDVGQGLQRAITSYNKAVGSFDRSVAVQARRIHELGGADAIEAPEQREVEVRSVDPGRYAGLGGGSSAMALPAAESA